MHVATTFSLKQGETRTSSGPISPALNELFFLIKRDSFPILPILYVRCNGHLQRVQRNNVLGTSTKSLFTNNI